MTAILWFRRDLRLTDNHALQTALEHAPVIPVFIFDSLLLSRPAIGRQNFLFNSLRALDEDLRKRGSRLIVRRGEPLLVLSALFHESQAAEIIAEEDTTPYARKRDQAIARKLPLRLVFGQTVHHPDLIKTKQGKPYTIYTPFSRAWKLHLPSSLPLSPAPDHIPTPENLFSELIPDAPESDLFPAGEAGAMERLRKFSDPGRRSAIYAYGETRNRLDLDGTSSLSPYIRFGVLGLRQVVQTANQALLFANDIHARKSAEVWLNELIWREFYISILYHFPHVSQTAFRQGMQNIAWRNEPSEFEAWKNGVTGVPVVDAAMRQLRATGWMHNRARMIAASYLVKDLLVDWQWGEQWFMETLLDGDPAANNGGWQWSAGTGTDAAPYFRIFNPALQSKKFDPDGDYIRTWVPELAHLPSEVIHAPHEHNIRATGYPAAPLVDHKFARERALEAYKRAIA